MIDLISSAVGGRVIACNDEFFAEAVNLIEAADPVSNDEYTDRGKWMDGWETRRRREPGHDWCVIALGVPGRVEHVEVDTSFFTGNFPESFSLEGRGVDYDDLDIGWEELLPQTGLAGDSRVSFQVDGRHRLTQVRLNIYPDGGVARLRVQGQPIPDRDLVCGGHVDLLSALVGGEAVDASDIHYSHPSNLLRPTEPAGMWDGWETKRRRGPGNDWATFRLGMPGSISSVVIDTRHFKGNAPGWVSVSVSDEGVNWDRVLDQIPVGPHAVAEIAFPAPTPSQYLRVDIHPDGGLARVRALGEPDPTVAIGRRIEYLDSLTDSAAEGFFRSACAADAWVAAMVGGRPFGSLQAVLEAASSAFDDLSELDWLQAFAGHPRIGERGDETANQEQAASSSATQDVRSALAEVNRLYEERFGFTYIVYATGKSGQEMLDIARERLGADREHEVVAASREQRAITDTRLRRMLCEGRSS